MHDKEGERDREGGREGGERERENCAFVIINDYTVHFFFSFTRAVSQRLLIQVTRFPLEMCPSNPTKVPQNIGKLK